MAEPSEHSACRDTVVQMFAERGIEVDVSAAAPIVGTGYEEAPFTCPHGVTYWAEPTSGQRAQWVKDGTP